MALFFAGAFCSSILINFIQKRAKQFSHSIPLLVEAIILFYVGYLGNTTEQTNSRDHFLAGSLLFAMGMQNAMVTVVSGFVVRTTHLTGLFTDLGIELAKLLYSQKQEKQDLKKKIILHGTIVIMFISGGVIGGIAFHQIHYSVFMIASSILIFTLFYDSMRIRIYKLRKKLNAYIKQSA